MTLGPSNWPKQSSGGSHDMLSANHAPDLHLPKAQAQKLWSLHRRISLIPLLGSTEVPKTARSFHEACAFAFVNHRSLSAWVGSRAAAAIWHTPARCWGLPLDKVDGGSVDQRSWHPLLPAMSHPSPSPPVFSACAGLRPGSACRRLRSHGGCLRLGRWLRRRCGRRLLGPQKIDGKLGGHSARSWEIMLINHR